MRALLMFGSLAVVAVGVTYYKYRAFIKNVGLKTALMIPVYAIRSVFRR
jgi:hypothetical protein